MGDEKDIPSLMKDEVPRLIRDLVLSHPVYRDLEAQCAAMREALGRLRNEARAFLSVHEDPGVTNIRVLELRIEEANTALASDAGKALLERLEKVEAALAMPLGSAQLIRAEERERCAKVADQGENDSATCAWVAEKIRALKEGKP